MYRATLAAIGLLVVTLTACGEADRPAADAVSGSRVPDDNVFKDQVHALEKAEQVQNTVNEAAARRRAVIEEQSR
jgi:hypothetical protein